MIIMKKKKTTKNDQKINKKYNQTKKTEKKTLKLK